MSSRKRLLVYQRIQDSLHDFVYGDAAHAAEIDRALAQEARSARDVGPEQPVRSAAWKAWTGQLR
jgi:hypothetical protein